MTTVPSEIKNVSSIVRGNVGIVLGTWTAAGGAEAAITAGGGGTAVIAGGVNVSAGMSDTTAKPVLVSYSFVDGNPDMRILPNLSTDAGTYWMIVKLS